VHYPTPNPASRIGCQSETPGSILLAFLGNWRRHAPKRSAGQLAHDAVAIQGMAGLKRRNCFGKGEIALALERRDPNRGQLRVGRPIRAQLHPPARIGSYCSCKLVVGQHGVHPRSLQELGENLHVQDLVTAPTWPRIVLAPPGQIPMNDSVDAIMH
jgi:hypothetical protein